jgi:non-ribosomal peptide synthetase component F
VNAYSHQDLPFEAIIDALGLPRELGQAPLAQAYFNLVELAPLTPSLAGLTTTRLDPTTVVAKLDIDLHAEAQGETLRLSLIPRRDLFDHEQGRVMLAHLIELLEQVIADPDRPVSTLPLTHPIALPPRAQRVKGASRPGFVGLAEGARDQGLSAAFRQVVERQPDAVALDTGTEQIRYRDLDQRAEALAARLARALEEGSAADPSAEESGSVCSSPTEPR